MTDAELASCLEFAAMAVNRGLPTAAERKRVAERYGELLDETTHRRELRALGYNYWR
jgi:hypothetical protein